jgi:hypothetical protein
MAITDLPSWPSRISVNDLKRSRVQWRHLDTLPLGCGGNGIRRGAFQQTAANQLHHFCHIRDLYHSVGGPALGGVPEGELTPWHASDLL